MIPTVPLDPPFTFDRCEYFMMLHENAEAIIKRWKVPLISVYLTL